MLIINFINIECKEDKISFILNIIVLSVVFLVHINYLVNPNLKTLINELMIGEKALYITQNYIYFGFMYVLLFISKLINFNYR